MSTFILAELRLLHYLLIGGAVFIICVIAALRCYRKIPQGRALIRTGFGGSKVAFDNGLVVIPVAHRMEIMDISVKRIEIDRKGLNGLICKDNMRADIKVAFFVRVNKTKEDVLSVAQMIGVDRASDQPALIELFDAKFSEALKTVGKQFDFEDLYTQRQLFKERIIEVIGTDLNGYSLEDAAIDDLEQTPKEMLNPDNILDVQGLEKIAIITRERKVKINEQEREEEKEITRQDVDAREKILDMEKELAEAEQNQQKEIANITARTHAEAEIVRQEEKLKEESARIVTDEAVAIAEENKNRQIIVAEKNKQRTEAVETERVEKDRQLEVTERERVVTLADIEKEKAVEVERKNIQEVIRERVHVERTVVEEEERIKDTKEFATADRTKQVAITLAEKDAQEILVREVQAAEASKQSAEIKAQEAMVTHAGLAEAQKKAAELKAEEKVIVETKAALAAKEAAELYAQKTVIDAEAHQTASGKESEAKKMLAEGITAEEAASGLATANVKTALAAATLKEGSAEADVMEKKFHAEAKGIEEKAEAMKLLDGVGKEHEEFKIRINKDKEVELAAIRIQAEIAAAQAEVLKEGLKSANIDIVGGESMFFDKMLSSITTGKTIDGMVQNSNVLTDVKNTFFDGKGNFKEKLQGFIDKFGVSSEDLKNLSAAVLLNKLANTVEGEDKALVTTVLDTVKSLGMGNKTFDQLMGGK
ncbi:MAG: flotillin family protein [Lentisphaeraceae bacterium]|nr:flotillin family protein [Lentisphaeraceae bacterium]